MLDGSGKLLTSDIEALSAALGNLTIKQQAAILATQGFNSEQVAQVLAAQGATNAEIAQALATTGLIAKTKQLSYEQAYQNIVALAGNEEKAEAIIKSLGLTVAENGELVVEQNLTKEKILATAAQQGLNTAQAEGIATSLGYSGATSGLMNGLKGLGTQVAMIAKQLFSLATAHPIITAITLAIGALAIAYNTYKQRREAAIEKEKEAREQLEKNHETQKQELTDLQSIIKQYEDLSKKTKLTAEDKETLVNLQTKLSESYGAETKGIDLLNGKYEKQIDLLKELNGEKEKELYNTVNALRIDNQRNYNNNTRNSIFTEEMEIVQDDDLTEKIWSVWQNIGGVEFDNGTPVLSENLNSEQKVRALNQMMSELRKNTTTAEKETEYYALLMGRLAELSQKYQKEVDQYNSSLKEEAQLAISSFSIDGITSSNVTPETYEKWVNGLIETFASEDDTLKEAIYTNLRDTFDDSYRLSSMSAADLAYYWSRKAAEESSDAIKKAFDFSTFYEENDLENVEKRLNKLKSAQKDLADGKLGTELGTDFYTEFPELLKYANASTETLTLEMAKLARIDVSQYVKELRLELEKATSPAQKQALQAAINILNGMADITTKIEEKTTKTSDLYKDEQSELKKQIEYTTKLVNDAESRKKAEENNLEILEKQKESLEKSISDYETAADTVQDYIDEQIENQKTLKEETEDRYDKEIQAIQDEIDALDKEADQRDRINDLREKELALEKAKNTKVRVYSAASGWSIQTDKQAVNVAQQEYDNALKDYKVDQLNQNKEDLTKAKEGATTEYDNEIKALEEYKTKWEEAVKSYQKAQDEMTTAATFGADWREQVINKDVNLVNGFVVSYNEAQTQLHNIVEPAIEQKEKEIDAIDREIDSYNTLKDKQKEYLNFFKTYAEDYAKVYTDTSNTLTKSWNEFAQAVRSNADASELFRLYENAMSAFNEDYTKTLPEYANGGVMSTTGLNIGHGTKQRSEVVFNAADAKKLYDMIHGSSVTHLANTVAGNFAKAAVESSGNVDNSKVMTNNSYTWQISGNDMRINNYAEFKGYMDRFIREAKQDMIVGK